MPTPLELILGVGPSVQQAAEAYQSEQPVSGTRAHILQYMQKVLNGEMSPEEAQVHVTAMNQGVHPTQTPSTPTQDATVPVTAQGGLGSRIDRLAAPSFAAHPAPTPAPPAAQPSPVQGLAAPAPTPAPAAPPAPPQVTPADVPAAEGAGLSAPPYQAAPPVPANAPNAQAALGIGKPKLDIALGSFDPSGYQSAEAKLAAAAAPKKMVPLNLDISKVKNRDFELTHNMLSDLIKTKGADKQAQKALELQVQLKRDELRAQSRMNLANMSAENKGRMLALELAQRGDLKSAELFQKYAALQANIQSREFAAKFRGDTSYRNAIINLIASLHDNKAQMASSVMSMMPEYAPAVADVDNTLSTLNPFLQSLLGAPMPTGGTSGSVSGSSTSTTAPVGTPAPAPAPAPAKSAPAPAPKPAPALKKKTPAPASQPQPKKGPPPTPPPPGSPLSAQLAYQRALRAYNSQP